MVVRVPSNDVLDPNAQVSKTCAGRIVGCFERVGPNSWDDYELMETTGDVIDLLPGLRVQVEEEGARVRLRSHGTVVVVEWQPSPEDQAALEAAAADDPESARRAYFLEHYLGGYHSKPGIGPAAAIARLLRH